MSIQQIVQLLNQQQIIGQQGVITFNLANISFPVTSKDIVGGVLQEWFENWMYCNQIQYSKKGNTQDWPDFYLGNGEHLEIKAFNHNATPAFDIGKFDAYIDSLLEYPSRLDSDHLIFSYTSMNGSIEIAEFWVKKVWQITGYSPTNCISLQVKKRGKPPTETRIPDNLRPVDWRGRSATFPCRRDFVTALDNALRLFYPYRYQNWFAQVETAYMQKTGTHL